jgi:hypothetical protein
MPGAFDIKDESKLKLTLDYLDKEMTLLGVLAAFSAAITGLALRELLRNENKGHVGMTHPEFICAVLGCLLLLSAAFSFGLQRIKVATRFGDICGSLLQPDEFKRSTTELLMEPISKLRWWRGYLIGGWLLALGLVELILAVVFFTLPADICSTRSVWLVALCPGALVIVYRLYRLVRKPFRECGVEETLI